MYLYIYIYYECIYLHWSVFQFGSFMRCTLVGLIRCVWLIRVCQAKLEYRYMYMYTFICLEYRCTLVWLLTHKWVTSRVYVCEDAREFEGLHRHQRERKTSTATSGRKKNTPPTQMFVGVHQKRSIKEWPQKTWKRDVYVLQKRPTQETYWRCCWADASSYGEFGPSRDLHSLRPRRSSARWMDPWDKNRKESKHQAYSVNPAK